MSEPVRLSRERWELLCGSPTLAQLPSVILQLPLTVETADGPLVFLPAEYVPASAQDHNPR